MRPIEKDEFVTRWTRIVAGAVREVVRAHGEVLPESIGKRVASQLWADLHMDGDPEPN